MPGKHQVALNWGQMDFIFKNRETFFLFLFLFGTGYYYVTLTGLEEAILPQDS
jgi:hypothetical protein